MKGKLFLLLLFALPFTMAGCDKKTTSGGGSGSTVGIVGTWLLNNAYTDVDGAPGVLAEILSGLGQIILPKGYEYGFEQNGDLYMSGEDKPREKIGTYTVSGSVLTISFSETQNAPASESSVNIKTINATELVVYGDILPQIQAKKETLESLLALYGFDVDVDEITKCEVTMIFERKS
jgi:hypothetical protein